MGKQNSNNNWIASLRLRWYLLLRDILSLWVKPRIKADPDGNTGKPNLDSLFTIYRVESKVFPLDQESKRAREMSACIASAAEAGSFAERMGLPTTK